MKVSGSGKLANGKAWNYYRCSTGKHVARHAQRCDEEVEATLLEWLSSARKVNERLAATSVDRGGLAIEAAALRARIDEAIGLWRGRAQPRAAHE